MWQYIYQPNVGLLNRVLHFAGIGPYAWLLDAKLAMPSIMAGVTQTVMLALAMVVIGSMIGASGLGLEVLRGIQQVDTGRAFTAGLGIVIIAIILDRISQNVGKGSPKKQRQSRRFLGILSRGQDISGGTRRTDK